MLDLILGCLKWAVVGFVVAFVLMKLYEGSHIHDDVPRPEFKLKQSRRAALGRNVKKFKEGDLAAVGCMVDACRDCRSCHENLEQFCEDVVFTYNSPDEHTGGVTYGGYSTNIVVDENFVLKVSPEVDLPA